jgi:hypothetical protein
MTASTNKSPDRNLGIHQISLSKILASMLLNPFHIPYVCYYSTTILCAYVGFCPGISSLIISRLDRHTLVHVLETIELIS